MDPKDLVSLVAASIVGALSFLIRSAISNVQRQNDNQSNQLVGVTSKLDRLNEVSAEDRGHGKVLANRVTQLEARIATLEQAVLNRRQHGPE